jgi:hypothetical protein
MFEIDQHVNLEAIEQDLSRVLAARNVDVIWPAEILSRSLGGESALIQLIATWAARSDNPVLTLPYEIATPSDVETFVQNVHGLVAALVTDSALDRTGNDRSDLVRAHRLLKLHKQEGNRPRDGLKRGESIAAVCADHLGFSAPRQLYSTTRLTPPVTKTINDFLLYSRQLLNASSDEIKVRSEEDFRKLASWLFRSMIPEATSLPAHIGKTNRIAREHIGSKFWGKRKYYVGVSGPWGLDCRDKSVRYRSTSHYQNCRREKWLCCFRRELSFRAPIKKAHGAVYSNSKHFG